MSDSFDHSKFFGWVTAKYGSTVAEDCKRRWEASPSESAYAILEDVLDERYPAPAGTLEEFGDFRFNS